MDEENSKNDKILNEALKELANSNNTTFKERNKDSGMLQTKKNMDDKSDINCLKGCDDDEMNEADLMEGFQQAQNRLFPNMKETANKTRNHQNLIQTSSTVKTMIISKSEEIIEKEVESAAPAPLAEMPLDTS